jgi:hypothetical protein
MQRREQQPGNHGRQCAKAGEGARSDLLDLSILVSRRAISDTMAARRRP